MPFALNKCGELRMVDGYGYNYLGEFINIPYCYGYSLMGHKYTIEEYFQMLEVCPKCNLIW